MATTFADRIQKAASDFPGATSTAWVQYLVDKDGKTVKVRMQAPEIFKQFDGSVKFGTDPKGILFFRKKSDLDIIGRIKVRNASYAVSGTVVIVETEFGAPGDDFFAFARFVAQVDTAVYSIPQFNSTAVGYGQMKPFDAVTCHMLCTRMDGNPTIFLGTNSIQKQVYFKSQLSTSFSESGVLFFNQIDRLKSKPNGRNNCVADYSNDRIVFHIGNGEDSNDFVGLFLPNTPITAIGPTSAEQPDATWDDSDKFDALAAVL